MRIIENFETVTYYDLNSIQQPLEFETPFVVAIDSGKINMGVVIGNEYGDVYKIYEISGKDIDTTIYCQQFKKFFKELFSRQQPIFGGQEQTILKKGQAYYHSAQVLSEIRGILLDTFVGADGILGAEALNTRWEQINNWSWKSEVLPPEYRTREVGKGSYLYCQTLNPIWKKAKETADATDAYCMYEYLIRRRSKNKNILCRVQERAQYKYEIYLTSPQMVDKSWKIFQFNPKFSLVSNAIYYSNRSSEIGVAKVNLESISVEDIYKYNKGCSVSHPVILVVKRK